jgi:hypothetical protein
VPVNYLSFIFNFLNWFAPLICILILSINILIRLSKREKIRKAKRQRAKNARIGGASITFNNQTQFSTPIIQTSHLKRFNRRHLLRLLTPGPQTKFMVFLDLFKSLPK